MTLQILPVLDLLGGTVVRGVAGRREEYRPVCSQLTTGSDPLAIATAFREKLGLSCLYLADLDAILHQRPNERIYCELVAAGFELFVDAGVTDGDQVRALLATGVSKAVLGLESWSGPAELSKVCADPSADRLIFSLDLQNGMPMSPRNRWETYDPLSIGSQAVSCGITHMIVLDLAQVGVNAGVSTSRLCQALKQRFPHLSLITGGGIRDVHDLLTLAETGDVEAVLVATALHECRIGAAQIARLAAGGATRPEAHQSLEFAKKHVSGTNLPSAGQDGERRVELPGLP